jgi:transposase
MGVSLSTVNRAHMAYDHGGLKALKSKPSGGRKRENMTLAEEKALLVRFANAGGAGEMSTISRRPVKRCSRLDLRQCLGVVWLVF